MAGNLLLGIVLGKGGLQYVAQYPTGTSIRKTKYSEKNYIIVASDCLL